MLGRWAGRLAGGAGVVGGLRWKGRWLRRRWWSLWRVFWIVVVVEGEGRGGVWRVVVKGDEDQNEKS